MAQQIQLRNGTAAQWTAANPTLAIGEVGLENDTGKQKNGNGATNWNGLAYANAGTGGGGAAGRYIPVAAGRALTSADFRTVDLASYADNELQTAVGSTAMTFVIPLDTVLGITGKAVLAKMQLGTGVTAFVPDTATGVVLNNPNNLISTQNSKSAIQWTGVNTWVLLG